MDRAVTYNLNDNFIDRLAGYLYAESTRHNIPLNKTACVFGGKRPGLFLKRQLAKRLQKGFCSPAIFSLDEFTGYIVDKNHPPAKVNRLDACYCLYQITKKVSPHIIPHKGSFGDFLGWGKEIISFIEQVDLELIEDKVLRNVEKSAAIGYDVPDNINRLLQYIITLRTGLHRDLQSKRLYSRGLIYAKAAEKIDNINFDEFESIYFANLFYLNNSETKIVKSLCKKGKAKFVFQGHPDEWAVLKTNFKKLKLSIPEPPFKKPGYKTNIYRADDMHSQVGIVRHILNKITDKNNTVIVTPRPEVIIPLISEISHLLGEFNVSVGYPVTRSSVYTLFNLLYKVNESTQDDKLYSKDYLSLLKHPLIKNLRIIESADYTRILVHKIEELLTGIVENPIGGSLFVRLKDIESQDLLYAQSRSAVKQLGVDLPVSDLKYIIRQVHKLLFGNWERLSDLTGFANAVYTLCDALVEKSMLHKFLFNLKVIGQIYTICDRIKGCQIAKVNFSKRQIWRMFMEELQSAMIAFTGSPVRGTQILGLFETRSLTFKNVIIMDVNESILPKLKIYEPLIPREVMLGLGLKRLEHEEEIQRYHFLRLLSGASDVHLIYEENFEHEKSRFIEEILWQQQKESKKMQSLIPPRPSFQLKIATKSGSIEKKPPMIEYLKKCTYSASRINVYLKCPLQFYFRYVLGLNETEDLLENPRSSQIGTFIHELLEYTFNRYLNKKPEINKSFREFFFSALDAKFKAEIEPRMRSDSVLLKEIISTRLKRFLNQEKERDVKKILALESEGAGKIEFKEMPINFKYTVDRIDKLNNGDILIIDYKTGGSNYAPKAYKQLSKTAHNIESIRKNIRSFQLPLYCHFIAKKFPDTYINAELYNVRQLTHNRFISDADRNKTREIMDICMNSLEFVLSHIFDINTPFEPLKNERHCLNCPFHQNLCI